MDESLALGVIAEQLGVPVDSLSAETAFADLNADSLELFQIIVALEEKFDIEFDNDRAESIKLVGDVLDYIAEYLSSLSEEEIQKMADTFTEGYRIGFELTGKDTYRG